MHRWSCLIVYLFLFYKSPVSNGIALPSILPKCNCIALKECHPYAYLLLNHEPHETDMINKMVQNANCGFAGLDPLVCCPSTTNAHHNIVTTRMHSNGCDDDEDEITSTSRAHPDGWVRNTEPQTMRTHFDKFSDAANAESSSIVTTRTHEGRSKGFHDETEIFDFKDPTSTQNFPHSFYEEAAIDSHNNYAENHKKSNFDQVHDCDDEHFESSPHKHNHHNFGEHRFHPHKFYHYHDHGKGEGDGADFEDDDNEYFTEDSKHTNFRPIDESAFVYPDDRRLNQPVHFPVHTTTTTTTQTPVIIKTTRKAGSRKTTSISRTTTIKAPTEPQTKPPTKPPTKPTVQSNVISARCGVADVDVSTGDRIYPWISRIAYVNKTNNVISYRCSGSVVSESHILTAAHCVINLVSNLQLSHVRIGGVTLSPNCTTNSNSNNNANCNTVTRRYQIAEVRVHPNYDQPKYANDIALVKIIGKADEYTPICLPPSLSTAERDQFIGSTGIALGWTADAEGNDTVTPRVRYLSLPIVNTTECAITYAKFSENFNDPIVITPSQLCAQGGPMNDVCRGDSGGPFMDEGSSGLINSNGRHTLMGIVAFGPTKCGTSNIPGVYTRVSSYLGWIIENIRSN